MQLKKQKQLPFSLTCRGIWQRVNVQNLKGHRGGKGRWNSHIRLCHSFQVETYFCIKELITLTVFAFALTRCILVGWRTRSHFTRQTLSSLKGSWSSTHRKYGICFTWSFSWTQIQMSDCPVEVNKSTSLTVFQMLPQTVWKNIKQYVFLIVPAVLRDMSRGRDLEQILTQYTTFVKPAFEEFCLPVSMKAYLKVFFKSDHFTEEISLFTRQRST